jgi:hypothetical protein
MLRNQELGLVFPLCSTPWLCAFAVNHKDIRKVEEAQIPNS